MTIARVICYIAVCNGCKQELETDYIVHHGSPGDAVGDAVDHDWVTVGDKLYCEGCAEGKGVPCAGCDDLVEYEGAYCRFCEETDTWPPRLLWRCCVVLWRKVRCLQNTSR